MAVSTGSDDDVMATINITPFTDVLLVLLIIFIILASITKEPPLPLAHNKDKVKDSQIVVTITDKNQIQIGSTFYSIADVPVALENLQNATNHNYNSIIIKADPKANYGTVLQLMDAAKKVDLTNFGLANKVQGAKS
jgi:biopolymer transport protein ExbD